MARRRPIRWTTGSLTIPSSFKVVLAFLLQHVSLFAFSLWPLFSLNKGEVWRLSSLPASLLTTSCLPSSPPPPHSLPFPISSPLILSQGRTATDLMRYSFADANPFTESADAFDEGLALFRAGDIPNAILAFESCVAKVPSPFLISFFFLFCSKLSLLSTPTTSNSKEKGQVFLWNIERIFDPSFLPSSSGPDCSVFTSLLVLFLCAVVDPHRIPNAPRPGNT